MYSHFTIIFTGFTCTLCYSNYDIFDGFDKNQSNLESVDITDGPLENEVTNKTMVVVSTTTETTFSATTAQANSTKTIFSTTSKSSSTTKKPQENIKPKAPCPEERPTNIGSYEVPTEKDIVIFTKDILLSMFETYERNAMVLLVDIKAATIATATLENKCPYNKQAYKQCVKRVSGQSEGVTKSLVNSLQMEKMDISALTDDAICSLSEMKSDPMSLIKVLSQETVMLKFALPGFLRLLHSCFELCSKSTGVAYAKKPLRRMTDQELVVKHFLTNKNYIELIKDSRRSV